MAEVIKLQNVSSEMVRPNTTTELDATLAVSTTAVAFAANDLATSCKYVRLQVQTNAVRITYDGSAPTSSNGEYIEPTQTTTVPRAVALQMRFIRAGAADATIWAQPYNVLAQ